MNQLRYESTRTLTAMALTVAVMVGTRADEQIFYIDQNLSVITGGGNVAGVPMQEQSPGSLTSHFAGTIKVDLATDSIVFPGGSFLDAQVSGDWQPGIGGIVGAAPADYGAKLTVLASQVLAALRNIQLDVTSGTLPLLNGSFDSSLLTFLFPTNSSSTADYRVTGLANKSGTAALSGLSTNRVTSLGTLTSEGAVQKLTIPVNSQYAFTISSFAGQVNLTGQIVATRTNDVSVGFAINSIGISNQVLSLQWDGAPGASYRIESTTDFNAWSIVLSNILGTGASQTITASVTGQSGFFRLAR